MGVVSGVGAIQSARAALAAGARTGATNLAEQLVLGEARAGAGVRILQGAIKDPRFPEAVWAKMQHVHRTPIGVTITDKGASAWAYGKTITIHYWQNLETGIRTGFKFVSP